MLRLLPHVSLGLVKSQYSRYQSLDSYFNPVGAVARQLPGSGYAAMSYSGQKFKPPGSRVCSCARCVASAVIPFKFSCTYRNQLNLPFEEA
jgi:hypothetical protein